jgi:hypothetical protein
MKHGLLAAAFLLTSAGFVSADYVILVANVGGGKELKTAGSGMAGMRGGMGGMQPGMGGMQPGMGGMRPGMGGMQPGQGGMLPGQGGMQPGQGGMQPGMGGMRPGMGGMQPGMGSGMMMGMRGGMMMGMRGGMMGGSMAAPDIDDVPSYVIAVVEVKPHKIPIQGIKKMGDLNKLDLPDNQLSLLPPIQVSLPERLGKSCYLLKKTADGTIEMFIITEGKNNAAIPTASQRFKDESENNLKGTPSANNFLYVARRSLELGQLDEFPKVMDKFVAVDKDHRTAVAYQKVKADLERPASNDPSVSSWRGKLLRDYTVFETPHYLIVHKKATDAEIKIHAEHLENAFRSFYYWFALHQVALPVPRHRQVVIVTTDKSDFDKLHKILSSGPVVVDGFFARRENLGVMSSQCQLDKYEALKTYWKTWDEKGFKRHRLLSGKSGRPSKSDNAMPLNVLAALNAGGLPKLAEAQMLALMLKALEQEAELATVSHDASRQLLFSSGLLPRNVAVPEWILFGMGSFLETPLQSPWPTIGGPSPYYLPLWRKLRNEGGLEKTHVQTLRKAVADGYFRGVPPDGKSGSDAHQQHESALRKARTISWSLTYYLALEKLDGLRRYFAELSKMPRDLELDDTVLLNCFARSFGCVDANNKVDEARLRDLAEKWFSYWQNVSFDSEPTMKEIREKIAKKYKEAQEQAQKQNDNNNGGRPGMFPGGGFPGAPGGGFPGAPGGRPGAPGGQPNPPQPGGGQRPGGN